MKKPVANLVGLGKAAELTGRNQSTIHRAARSGRLTTIDTGNGQRGFDTEELAQVFGSGTSKLPVRKRFVITITVEIAEE